MRATILAVLFLGLGLAWTAEPARADDGAEARAWTERFVGLLAEGKVSEGVQALVERFQSDRSDAASNPPPRAIQLFMDSYRNRLGEQVGHEMIGERRLGRSILRLAHLIRVPGQPVLVRLWFYDSGDGFRIANFAVDALVPREVDEILRD